MNLSNFQYFKRKRQNVEILSSLGTGLGLTIFSKLLNELIKWEYSCFSCVQG